MQETWVPSPGWEDPLEEQWQSNPVFLPGESQEERSLVGYSPQGLKELDTIEQACTHHSEVGSTIASNVYIRKGKYEEGFPGHSDGKEPTCNVGDLGLVVRLGRSPGGGYGNPLQYSCLEHPHGQMSLAGYSPQVSKSQT